MSDGKTILYLLEPYYYLINMSRTIERSAKMNEIIAVKAHQEDVALLKLAAQRAGTNVSNLIRQTLIKNGLINPI
jgi:hypothetical protein